MSTSVVKITMKNSSVRYTKPCKFEKEVVTDFCKSWNLKLLGVSRKNSFSFYTSLTLEQMLSIFNDSILLLKFDIIN